MKNKKHGRGKIITSEFIYDGDWKDDEKDGVGVLSYTDFEKNPTGVWYMGGFKKGEKSDFGI